MNIQVTRYSGRLCVVALLENPSTLAALTADPITATVYQEALTGFTAIAGMVDIPLLAVDEGVGVYGKSIAVPSGVSIASVMVVVRATVGAVSMVGTYVAGSNQTVVGGPQIVSTPGGIV